MKDTYRMIHSQTCNKKGRRREAGSEILKYLLELAISNQQSANVGIRHPASNACHVTKYNVTGGSRQESGK
jgi:hypothetical protein